MHLKRKFDILLLLLFLLFSLWLMNKSFGFIQQSRTFYVASNEVGDFGLHLSLIRSFSWGNNIPIESPFYPGKPLPYHYFFDFVAGMLEKLGFRIDIAYNGLSAISLTILLYFIYKLPQKIFGESTILGLLSVMLFVFHSSLTFIDFFKQHHLSLSLLRELWLLPDYIHKGPFDNSITSIFFTWNVLLNQRHLIAALAISVGIIYFLLPTLLEAQKTPKTKLITFGLALGLLSGLHTLIFLAMAIVLFFLCILFNRYHYLWYLFSPALLIFSLRLKDIFGQNLTHPLFYPGFLAQKPLTLESFLTFWVLNLGIAFFLIPLSVGLAKKNQQKIFLSILPLFFVGNLLQLSFRIDHNQSLFNLFFIFANFYIAFFLTRLWTKRLLGKILSILLVFLLTISGVIDLMPVKNDFRYPVHLGAERPFMRWLKDDTNPLDIFLSRQEILDPITLSGRKNYLGHRYYLEVMGYDFSKREWLVKMFFEASSSSVFSQMRKEHIKFIVLPAKPISDFTHKINREFFANNLPVAFQDEDVVVFKL